MDLRGITVNEISQRLANIAWYLKIKLRVEEVTWGLGGWGDREKLIKEDKLSTRR